MNNKVALWILIYRSSEKTVSKQSINKQYIYYLFNYEPAKAFSSRPLEDLDHFSNYHIPLPSCRGFYAPYFSGSPGKSSF